MPVRVLQIVNYMGRGGLETMLMNCFRHIDREVLMFDFLVHREYREAYDDEIEALGGKIYRLPRLNPFSPVYWKKLMTFFREHPEYRIVHCHMDCMSGFPLLAANRVGVPVRIAHAHSSDQDINWKYPLKRLFMLNIPAVTTHYFACSKAAGHWMFPRKTISIINNGIETNKFAFSETIRNTKRLELDLGTALTIGHVGRYMPPKNHSFLLEVFAEIRKQEPGAILLSVGEGPHEAEVREKVHKLGLDDSVRFLGVRADVNEILQAVDIFVQPSLYEGLSLTTVEAQTSGALCFFSDTVSADCKMTDVVTFLSLELSPKEWADRILAAPLLPRSGKNQMVTNAGFDIQTTADWLQTFYLNAWRQE